MKAGEALAWEFEPEAAAILHQISDRDRVIASWDDLKSMLDSAGLELKDTPPEAFHGRLLPHVPLTIAAAVNRMLKSGFEAVPVGKTLRVMRVEKTLEYWKTRTRKE